MTQPNDRWQPGELVRVVAPGHIPQRSPMNNAGIARAFNSAFDPKPTPQPSRPEPQAPESRDAFGGSDVLDSLDPDLKRRYFDGDRDAVAQVTARFRQEFPGERPAETSDALLPKPFTLEASGPSDVFSPALLRDTSNAFRESGVNVESAQQVMDWVGGLKDTLPMPDPGHNQIDEATAAQALRAEYGQNLDVQLGRARDALAVAAAFGAKGFGPEAEERLAKLNEYMSRTGVGNSPAAVRYLVRVADWLDRNDPSLMSNARAWRARARSR
jgi:hypothetical protein